MRTQSLFLRLPAGLRAGWFAAWLLLLSIPTFAQLFDPELKPFYHGVASGDPMSDRVIIWTHVTPEPGASSVAVTWKVATDPGVTQVVKSGTFVTDGKRDYTVKVDVTGLKPYQTYYYQFHASGKNSIVGRTKTAPIGDVDNLKFAVVSCNNFEGGYFSAFGRIADRNDLDAVIHLGDYIYEYGPGSYGAPGLIAGNKRPILPKNEIETLQDYRLRYSTYRLDEDLRRAHQQHPFITVWDDHESANDSYKDGAENHDPATEGPWEERKSVSRQAYEEWLPIRGDAHPIYRVKPYGNLVDLIMIDTRIAGRDQQINDITSPALYDPNRTILGATQREWLFDKLKKSTAKWKVIGNQVIFSEFNVGWAASEQLGTPQQLESIFLDIWDGYPAERQKVIDFIGQNKVDNVVLLTGDFHSSFAFDVAARPSVFSPGGPNYDPATGAGSVAVEFVTPSISSANFDENVSPESSAALEFQINKPLPAQAGPLAGVSPNPHMKFTDLDRHGYFILDLDKNRAQADWYFVNTILEPNSKETFAEGWYTLAGQNRLQKAAQESLAKAKIPAPAPERPVTGGTASAVDINLLGTYKTGVFDEGAQEIPAYDPKTKRLFVINANDGTVDVLDIKNPSKPTKLFTIDTEALAGGTPNSVAVKNGIVAMAIQLEDEETETQLPGRVALFRSDIAEAPTQFDQLVEVGTLPDMLTFTPDGKRILVANEGEPSDAADPMGSVSVINISGGIAAASVVTATFEAFDGKENELRAKGIRIFADKKVSEDVEPEYIGVSPDGKTALVTLQEAVAVGVLDIEKAAFVDILPLGLKDHSKGAPQLKQYNFNEPPIGQKADGEDLLFGGLSGLFFEKEEGGKQIFVTAPDRGPNGEETDAGRQFLKPDYVAEIIRFSLDPVAGTIEIIEKIPLTRKVGGQTVPITGFPNIPGVDEKPVDESGNALPYDPYGADLEGIVVAPDGSYWMVDEYRPSIYHFGKNGVLINRFVPKGTAASGGKPAGTYGAETLPIEYATRRANRGFEALALDTKKGVLYSFIQTPLANPDQATSDNSSVIRILGTNPATGEHVSEYVYLLEKPLVSKSLVDKMGDAAYDARTGRIFTIERDSDLSFSGKKFVFEMDLTGATNLLATDAPALLSGKTLEQHTPDELAALGIKPVFKRKVLNLPSVGYLPSDKPEGLTILPDGSLAVINDNDFGLEGATTVGLGVISFAKDYALDASDGDGKINIASQPVLGQFMPDAIASFQVNGETFYITANEGDTRGEEERIEDLTLDATAFPDAAAVQTDEQAGRLDVSPLDGDLNGDGDYDRLYSYGARSFTVWDAYGNLVYDSGNDFEQITADTYPDFFNVSNTDNEFDSRSDAKGPEPEGVTTGVLNGRTYAFVGLERIGGVMVYDVTNPYAPQFANYFNNRNFEGDPEAGTAGDLGPEGLVFIDAKDSPTGSPLLVVSNEVSGTTSIFGVSKPSVVETFTLVNATSDEDIQPLTDGAVLDYAELFATKLSVRANTSPDSVGSVVFALNGKTVQTQNLGPYSLFGDKSTGDYQPWTPEPGDYVLKATPYAGKNGKGAAGVPLTVSFKVIYTAKIASFTLVNAENTTDIRKLKDGDVINLRALATRKLSVRANASPESVGSVVFALNGNAFNTENILPYALFRNTPDNVGYKPWTPRLGTYTIQATPYAAANKNGAIGQPLTITVQVVDEPAVTRFALVDVTTGEEVREINDGDEIDLGKLGISNFNVRAITDPKQIGSILFGLNENSKFRTENHYPYELFADEGSAAAMPVPGDGTYNLKATIYPRMGRGGKAGTPVSLSFTLTNTTGGANARTAAAQAGSLEEAEPIREIIVFPNPVKDVLTIDFNETVSGELSIKFYDVLGRKAVLEDKIHVHNQRSVEVNVSGLPARHYILRLRTDTMSKSIKILKE